MSGSFRLNFILKQLLFIIACSPPRSPNFLVVAVLLYVLRVVSPGHALLQLHGQV
jgi:hypothetical protein